MKVVTVTELNRRDKLHWNCFKATGSETRNNTFGSLSAALQPLGKMRPVQHLSQFQEQ